MILSHPSESYFSILKWYQYSVTLFYDYVSVEECQVIFCLILQRNRMTFIYYCSHGRRFFRMWCISHYHWVNKSGLKNKWYFYGSLTVSQLVCTVIWADPPSCFQNLYLTTTHNCHHLKFRPFLPSLMQSHQWHHGSKPTLKLHGWCIFLTFGLLSRIL